MSHPDHPLLSVLIPAFNAERYLAEAIESVLSQDWKPLEIVVVDDGSEDRSAIIAESFGPPVRCVRRPHGGLAAARNAAVAEARGQFIAFLDADDLFTPGSLAVRMAAFQNDPSTEAVLGRYLAFHSPELNDQQQARFVLTKEPQRGHVGGTTIFRAEVFNRVGQFNELLTSGPDLDWFIRAKDQEISMRYLSDIVSHRRIHGLNMSLTLKETLSSNRARILKAALDRRRAAAGGEQS